MYRSALIRFEDWTLYKVREALEMIRDMKP